MINKYYIQQQWISEDGGVTWHAVDVYQRGAMITKDRCNQEGETRWRTLTPTSDPSTYICEDCYGTQYRVTTSNPYCVDGNKFVNAFSQVSHDGGKTWETVAIIPILIEINCSECEYE